MRTNNKKGISLLVLVITILVMVILAGAIILQIRNSKITEKAEKAKVSSDNANLKEYIELVKADWEMMTKKEQKATGCKTRAAYINKMLEQEGYTNVTVGTDGTIYTDLNDVAKDAISQGIKIGDRVNYVVEEKSTISYASVNGWGDRTHSSKTDCIWRYMGINEDGKLLIIPDMLDASDQATPYVTFYGKIGFKNGADEIDRICRELFSTDKGTARGMNLDDVNRILGWTGEKGSYIDKNGNYTTTSETKTISEIAKELDYDMSNFDKTIPEDGKNVGDYKSNYYKIDKNSDVSKMKYPENMQYVFEQGSYWLATADVWGGFKEGVASFGIFECSSQGVSELILFNIRAGEVPNGHYSRPVVELEAKIIKSSDSDGIIWNVE